MKLKTSAIMSSTDFWNHHKKQILAYEPFQYELEYPYGGHYPGNGKVKKWADGMENSHLLSLICYLHGWDNLMLEDKVDVLRRWWEYYEADILDPDNQPQASAEAGESYFLDFVDNFFDAVASRKSKHCLNTILDKAVEEPAPGSDAIVNDTFRLFVSFLYQLAQYSGGVHFFVAQTRVATLFNKTQPWVSGALRKARTKGYIKLLKRGSSNKGASEYMWKGIV